MKQLTFIPLAILFFSAGAVNSQAPLTESAVASSLQAIVTANKALIDKQQKTLDGLDQLGDSAQQLKTFSKRS